MQSHIERIHVNQKVIRCEIYLTSKYTYDKHNSRAHIEHYVKVKCDICFKDYNTIESYKDHFQSKHQNKRNRFHCQLCEKIFSKRIEAVRHIEKRHNKDHVKMLKNMLPEAENAE